ncbi:MAG TPA: antibiotic biosynthesis monooxygenase [Candidatus Dormibacteraeota bacterium]|nr:antibiotic biosynthesis monooxygenase [Candidatus Dormibacteraeota bacterium]
MSADPNPAYPYCHIVRTKVNPSRVDEMIELWTQEIVPVLKKQKGFGGVTLIGNRKIGSSVSVSYWESESAMQDARQSVRPKAATTLAKTGGSIIEDDECDVAFLERFQPARAGGCVRLTTVQGNPAQLSQAVTNFKETIVPSVRRQPGARTAYFFANRQTGKTFAGSVWDTQQDLQKSEAAISELRAEAINRFGGREAKTEALEMYFIAILPATAAVS